MGAVERWTFGVEPLPQTERAATRLRSVTDRLLAMEAEHPAVERLIADLERADAELATLIAIKRIDDYKRSLRLRNVRGIDAPGTYGWILHQQRKNLGRTDGARFDELLASAALSDLATSALRDEQTPTTEAVPA